MEKKISKGSLASIIKWGKLNHFYPVPDQLIPLIEEFLGPIDSNIEQLSNLEEITLSIPSPQLKSEIVNEVKQIVGNSNVSTDDYDRVWCSVGYSYYDVIRLRLGEFETFPDIVVYPKDHDEVQAIVNLANTNKIPVIPIGARTGVTQASESVGSGIALDLTKNMKQILALDETSLTIRCQAGIMLPELENYLNEHGFMLGHFPQSFEYTSLGGSIATRGAGQQSTKYGKIEDMVLGLRLATPAGEKHTVEFPASAMGPDLVRVIAGSEGTLGIITDVLLTIHQYLPQTRDFSSFLFKNFTDGISAIREIMQYGVVPATVRLSDPEETQLLTKLGTTGHRKRSKLSEIKEKLGMKYLRWKGYFETPCLLILEYEGEKEIVRLTRSKSHEICKKWKGFSMGRRPGKEWWSSRYELPYLRDDLMDLGILVDTLETATSWSRAEEIHEAVTQVLRKHCGIVMAHISHVYRGGGAIYFTYLAKRSENPVQQILDIQQDVLTTLNEEKAALSHHHGIGRAFKKWFMNYSEAEVIIGLKKLWDPNNIMNPGNLIEY